jgi:hypothetical protein
MVEKDNLLFIIWRPAIDWTYLITFPNPAATPRVVMDLQSAQRPSKVKVLE